MSTAEEKAAMLEKIRADMAATRERLAKMKEQRAKSPAVNRMTPTSKPATTTATTTTTTTKTGFAAKTTTSLKPTPKINTPAGGTWGKAQTQTKPRSQGSFANASGVGFSGAIPTTATTPVATTTATTTTTTAVKTTAAAKSATGSGFTKATVTAKPATTTVKKGAVADKKNIRSLADLQAAIRKADRVKKQVQTQGKIEEMRRHNDNMTREERIAYRKSVRASKRMTMEMKNSEARVKVDTQIGNFMKMLMKLEDEWSKSEDARYKKEKELIASRNQLVKMGEQVETLGKVVSNFGTQVDHLKNVLDRLNNSMPPKTKKADDRWTADFNNFFESYLGMRHQMYVQIAKHNKEMKKFGEELQKNMPPPPSGGPNSAGSRTSVGKVNPVSSLLSQIRTGTQLKKLDPKQIEKERKARKGEFRKSVALLQGLQDTLRDALDQRHLAMFSDSDEENDDDMEEEWED